MQKYFDWETIFILLSISKLLHSSQIIVVAMEEKIVREE